MLVLNQTLMNAPPAMSIFMPALRRSTSMSFHGTKSIMSKDWLRSAFTRASSLLIMRKSTASRYGWSAMK
ncbi:hypothetical protein D3C78_1872500 [compost metagenome]